MLSKEKIDSVNKKLSKYIKEKKINGILKILKEHAFDSDNACLFLLDKKYNHYDNIIKYYSPDNNSDKNPESTLLKTVNKIALREQTALLSLFSYQSLDYNNLDEFYYLKEYKRFELDRVLKKSFEREGNVKTFIYKLFNIEEKYKLLSHFLPESLKIISNRDKSILPKQHHGSFNHYKQIKAFCDLGFNPNTCYYDGQKISYHYLAGIQVINNSISFLEEMKVLEKEGVDFFSKNKKGFAPFHKFISKDILKAGSSDLLYENNKSIFFSVNKNTEIYSILEHFHKKVPFLDSESYNSFPFFLKQRFRKDKRISFIEYLKQITLISFYKKNKKKDCCLEWLLDKKFIKKKDYFYILDNYKKSSHIIKNDLVVDLTNRLYKDSILDRKTIIDSLYTFIFNRYETDPSSISIIEKLIDCEFFEDISEKEFQSLEKICKLNNNSIENKTKSKIEHFVIENKMKIYNKMNKKKFRTNTL